MIVSHSLLGSLALALHLPVHAQVAPTAPEVETPTAEVPSTVAAPALEVDVAVDAIERALVLLSGYHGLPSVEELEAALSNPRDTMFAILQRPDLSPMHRDRAIGALQYWPNHDVQTYYRSLLADPATPEMVRHRVLGHLAVGFGDAAIDLISPYLGDQDVQFRLTAVHALGQIGTPAALQRIEAAAQLEQSQVVLEQMQHLR